jgi:transcriptional regulator with XRE-family HTH domain
MSEQEQDKRKLGARITQLREAAGLSQLDLAAQIDEPVVTVSRWEQGLRVPTALALKAMARALDKTADEILAFDALEPTKRGRGRPRKKEPTG